MSSQLHARSWFALPIGTFIGFVTAGLAAVLIDVQQALRASMGLEQPPMSTPVFLERLQPELAQLRKLGRSNAEIVMVIAAALGAAFPSQVLDDRIGS